MLKILGCRGTIPISNRKNSKFGTNTSCLYLKFGEVAFIFDGGTGIYEINKEQNLKNINIFLTHLHWDHIIGLPLFNYFYQKNININIYVAEKEEIDTTDFIQYIFKKPFFPVSHETLNCNLKILKIDYSKKFQFDHIEITPYEGNHPNGVTMYRIETEKVSYLYATDFEHGSTKDDTLISAAKNVDYLIYDTTYTPEDYSGNKNGIKKEGWGHSTYEFGVKFAQQSNAKNLVLFHHNPDYNDCILEEMKIRATRLFKNSLIACEGEILK